MKERNSLPQWASRVTQREIRQLYETDARGIYDEELIDSVGYGLLARCESFITAVEAVAGRAACPCCPAVVEHSSGRDEVLRCDCGWELTWGEYFRTIQHRQLSGAEPVVDQFQTYKAGFTAARTTQEKMLAIDRLVHGFHWFLSKEQPTRPVAVNLIEGKLRDVVLFLDRLTYGDGSTPGTRDNFTQWSKNLDANREWYSYRDEGSESPEPPSDQV